MGDMIVQLVPLMMGVILSPLAIMALVAELLSRRNRINGISFTIGWALAIVVLLALFSWLFIALDVHTLAATPIWVSVLRVVIGLFLAFASIWIYRRAAAHTKKMAVATTPGEVVAAAPQLPGWLKTVENFTPFRSFLLGFGIFALNPVDASCAILAALAIVSAGLTVPTSVTVAVIFLVIGILPILVPVIIVLARGKAADPFLKKIRIWIGGHTGAMNAAFVLIIGVLQLQKGISALVG